ncbi:competence protein ComG [Bacillus sp. AGMB 02131]|uniref:Competence protein ComG n=1 Tax=Peribacillus faecalis TaxID=2772559 RepID=A0A927CZ23_9BACI|nr:ComZ family protein [Peribacillus faecalis]MBD3110328.1 competence protein ComG [Peribacillus faecalis]
MSRKRQMEFMNIAMKYFPEGKERLKSVGIDVSLNQLPIFMDLFTKVMDEAYEMGRRDALNKK